MDVKLIETSGLGKNIGLENADARWGLNWAVFSWTLLRQTSHWGLIKTVCALKGKKKLLVGCENDVCLEPCSCRNACCSCLPAGWLLTVFRFKESNLSQFKPAWMPKRCPYFSHCGLYSSTAPLPLAPETDDTCKDKPRVKIKASSQIILSSHVLAYTAHAPHGFSSALAEPGWILFRFSSICAIFWFYS